MHLDGIASLGICQTMNIQKFFHEIRSKYPELTDAADKEHMQKFFDGKFEYVSLWFESFSNALNSEMNKATDPEQYIELFKYFGEKFETETEEIRKYIDVYFVENLFWRVSPKYAVEYWFIITENLKNLYVNFHGKNLSNRSFCNLCYAVRDENGEYKCHYKISYPENLKKLKSFLSNIKNKQEQRIFCRLNKIRMV